MGVRRKMNRLPCGCRKALYRRRGHSPRCAQWDRLRAAGQRQLRRLRRKYEDE